MPATIPQNWQETTLRATCEATRTWNPLKEPRDHFWYVDVSAVSRDSLAIREPQRIKANEAPSRARKIIHSGDTIFATVRPTLRRIAFVEKEFDDQIASTAFCVLRPNTNKAVPRFLYYVLQTDQLNEEIAKFESGASYPAVNDKDVLDRIIPLPPKPEQEKIAALLWKIQSATETEEKLIATARELKQSAMRQLFMHGLHGAPQKETDFGPIPANWDIRSLGELIDVVHGFAFQSTFFQSSGPVVLTPGNFKLDGGLYWGQNTKFTSQSCPEEFRFAPHDLVVVMTDLTPTAKLLGSPAFIPSNKVILHNQRIGKVVFVSEKLSKEFLYWVFLTHPFKNHMVKTATGSTVRHTSPGRIKSFLCPIPPQVEQDEIVALLQTIDRKISVHERKRAVLQELFKTLLNQLMTAKIRVHDVDIDVSEIKS
jgi:type I restriction enzyme S subunit